MRCESLFLTCIQACHIHSCSFILISIHFFCHLENCSIHKVYCFRQGIQSPISDLTQRLLFEDRDPPGIPQEILYEAPPFDEVFLISVSFVERLLVGMIVTWELSG